MKGFIKKIIAIVLALSVAMMPVAAGAATKSSTSTSKSTKTTTTATTTPKTQTNTTKKAETTKNTEEEKTESKVETETEKKSEDNEKKTESKVEENTEDIEGDTYPKVTYELSNLKVTLDNYLVFANGEKFTPDISVSATVSATTTTRYEVIVKKTDEKSDEKSDDKTESELEGTTKTGTETETKSDTKTPEEKLDSTANEKASDLSSETGEQVEDETETKIEYKSETITFDKNFEKDEYEVKYYKIVGSTYEEVSEIKDIGEYAVRVSLNAPYEKEIDTLFSVIGKPQTLTVNGTEFKIYVGDSIELSPSATGDGTGVTYSVSRKGIVGIDEGTIVAEKPGIVEVTVKTTGNKLYQPATVKVEITVKPDKVTWSKAKKSKKSTTLSWDKQSVTGYNLRYCTEKTFKKPAKTAKKYKSRIKAYKYKRYVVKGSTKKTISYKSGYVKIRAYVRTTDARGNVKYIYGAWSEVKKIS